MFDSKGCESAIFRSVSCLKPHEKLSTGNLVYIN